MARKFTFKICKNSPSLLEGLQTLRRNMATLVRENVAKWPQLALLRLNFYLVLDNIKGLLEIERQKRCLEKFAIIQSML